MSNLRLINETTNSSDVSSITIDNVFNADFDIYYFTINNILSADTNEDTLGIRLINSSGSVSSSNYLRAILVMRAFDTFQEANSVKTFMNLINFGNNSQSPSSLSGYFFNPFNSSSYTFNTFQSTTDRASGFDSRKGINAHTVAQAEKGYQIINNAGNNMESGMIIRTYGLRVDS